MHSACTILQENNFYCQAMRRISEISIITILGCINALFAWKYVSRVDNSIYVMAAVLISLLTPFLIFSIYSFRRKGRAHVILSSKITTILIVAAFVLISIFFFIRVPQDSLRVDRYEMIRLFWENLLANRCPYCPRSAETNIPGPFPFYFFGAFPFFLAGEIGFYSLAGFFLFTGILIKAKHIRFDLKNTLLLLLITSPAFIFEIFCRSTNFLNSTFLLLCGLIISRTVFRNHKSVLITGILTGLALSTRSISFLVIALAFIYTLKKNILSPKASGMYATAAVVFLLTFLPVVLICKATFFKYNPFSVQASLAPPLLLLAIAPVSCILAYRAIRFSTLNAITGFTLFILVAGYAVNIMVQRGFKDAIFSSAVDISYFSLALPFLLYSLGREFSENKSGTLKSEYEKSRVQSQTATPNRVISNNLEP